MFATSSPSSGSNKSTCWIVVEIALCTAGDIGALIRVFRQTKLPKRLSESWVTVLYLFSWSLIWVWGYLVLYLSAAGLSVVCYLRSSLRRVHYEFLAQPNFPCLLACLARWVTNFNDHPNKAYYSGKYPNFFRNFCTYLNTSILALSSYPLLFTSFFFFFSAWKIKHRWYSRRGDPTTLKNLPAKKSNV